MNAVNIFDAKTNLSKYISNIEEKKEQFIVIMRNGKPVAKIIPYEDSMTKKIGVAKNQIPNLNLNDFNSIDCESEFEGNGSLL